jgi:predicted nucleic acid-binding Zn ribbon protein
MPYRKRTEPFADPKFFCVVCRNEIPADRVLLKAVTCSKDCAREHKNMKRRLRDTERCRFCNRPSTPAERAQFVQWRKEKRTQETAARREKKKLEKEAAKAETPPATPIEEHLGTVTV